jgi:hypothetical protein
VFWDKLDVTRWGLAVADHVAALEAGMQEVRRQLFEDEQLASLGGDARRDAAFRQTRRLLRLDATALSLTVSLNHLATALRAHPELGVEDQELFDRARLLRNLFEHWDETRVNFAQPDEQARKAVRIYKAQHPGERP